MGVPIVSRIAVVDLDEPHSRLGQSTGKQALATEFIGMLVANAVQLARRLGFVLKVEHSRRGHLHAEGKLKRLEAGLQSPVRSFSVEMSLILYFQVIQETTLPRLRRSGGEIGDLGVLE